LNIVSLRYAVEVEKTGSITRAAHNLYLRQPNVSKAIKELEEELGIVIFTRTSKGVVPTSVGKRFLSHARSILAQIDHTKALYNASSPDKIFFSIAVPRASYVTYAFTEFVNALDFSKEIDINFRETNTTQAIGSVASCDCNLGIIRYEADFDQYFLNVLEGNGIQHRVLWEFKYELIISKNHPLAQKEVISREDLSEYTELLHGDVSMPFEFDDTMRIRTHAERHRKIYLYERGSQFDLLCRVPTTYIWGSPVPDEILERHGLVRRSCGADGPTHKDVLIYLKDYKLGEIDRAFISELARVKELMSWRE